MLLGLAIIPILGLKFIENIRFLNQSIMKHYKLKQLIFSLIFAAQPLGIVANELIALQAMENPSNPLILLSTSLGDIYIELFPSEAPKNVANFLALAHGEIEFLDPNSGVRFQPRYFDGMQFHRVVPDNFIQAGSPLFNPLGSPDELLADEINADLLGLNQQLVMDDLGNFNPRLNIGNKTDFLEELLNPIFDHLNIESESEILERQHEVYDLLTETTIKQAYEYKGYRYQANFATREITRSTVALANTGPNTNGPEFFIAIQDLSWLDGRHTVIGKVVEGMNTVDAIGSTVIDPLSPTQFATLIYSLRQIN